MWLFVAFAYAEVDVIGPPFEFTVDIDTCERLDINQTNSYIREFKNLSFEVLPNKCIVEKTLTSTVKPWGNISGNGYPCSCRDSPIGWSTLPAPPDSSSKCPVVQGAYSWLYDEPNPDLRWLTIPPRQNVTIFQNVTGTEFDYENKINLFCDLIPIIERANTCFYNVSGYNFIMIPVNQHVINETNEKCNSTEPTDAFYELCCVYAEGNSSFAKGSYISRDVFYAASCDAATRRVDNGDGKYHTGEEQTWRNHTFLNSTVKEIGNRIKGLVKKNIYSGQDCRSSPAEPGFNCVNVTYTVKNYTYSTYKFQPRKDDDPNDLMRTCIVPREIVGREFQEFKNATWLKMWALHTLLNYTESATGVNSSNWFNPTVYARAALKRNKDQRTFQSFATVQTNETAFIQRNYITRFRGAFPALLYINGTTPYGVDGSGTSNFQVETEDYFRMCPKDYATRGGTPFVSYQYFVKANLTDKYYVLTENGWTKQQTYTKGNQYFSRDPSLISLTEKCKIVVGSPFWSKPPDTDEGPDELLIVCDATSVHWPAIVRDILNAVPTAGKLAPQLRLKDDDPLNVLASGTTSTKSLNDQTGKLGVRRVGFKDPSLYKNKSQTKLFPSGHGKTPLAGMGQAAARFYYDQDDLPIVFVEQTYQIESAVVSCPTCIEFNHNGAGKLFPEMAIMGASPRFDDLVGQYATSNAASKDRDKYESSCGAATLGATMKKDELILNEGGKLDYFDLNAQKEICTVTFAAKCEPNNSTLKYQEALNQFNAPGPQIGLFGTSIGGDPPKGRYGINPIDPSIQDSLGINFDIKNCVRPTEGKNTDKIKTNTPCNTRVYGKGGCTNSRISLLGDPSAYAVWPVGPHDVDTYTKNLSYAQAPTMLFVKGHTSFYNGEAHFRAKMNSTLYTKVADLRGYTGLVYNDTGFMCLQCGNGHYPFDGKVADSDFKKEGTRLTCSDAVRVGACDPPSEFSCKTDNKIDRLITCQQCNADGCFTRDAPAFPGPARSSEEKMPKFGWWNNRFKGLPPVRLGEHYALGGSPITDSHSFVKRLWTSTSLDEHVAVSFLGTRDPNDLRVPQEGMQDLYADAASSPDKCVPTLTDALEEARGFVTIYQNRSKLTNVTSSARGFLLPRDETCVGNLQGFPIGSPGICTPNQTIEEASRSDATSLKVACKNLNTELPVCGNPVFFSKDSGGRFEIRLPNPDTPQGSIYAHYCLEVPNDFPVLNQSDVVKGFVKCENNVLAPGVRAEFCNDFKGGIGIQTPRLPNQQRDENLVCREEWGGCIAFAADPQWTLQKVIDLGHKKFPTEGFSVAVYPVNISVVSNIPLDPNYYDLRRQNGFYDGTQTPVKPPEFERLNITPNFGQAVCQGFHGPQAFDVIQTGLEAVLKSMKQDGQTVCPGFGAVACAKGNYCVPRLASTASEVHMDCVTEEEVFAPLFDSAIQIEVPNVAIRSYGTRKARFGPLNAKSPSCTRITVTSPEVVVNGFEFDQSACKSDTAPIVVSGSSAVGSSFINLATKGPPGPTVIMTGNRQDGDAPFVDVTGSVVAGISQSITASGTLLPGTISGFARAVGVHTVQQCQNAIEGVANACAENGCHRDAQMHQNIKYEGGLERVRVIDGKLFLANETSSRFSGGIDVVNTTIRALDQCWNGVDLGLLGFVDCSDPKAQVWIVRNGAIQVENRPYTAVYGNTTTLFLLPAQPCDTSIMASVEACPLTPFVVPEPGHNLQIGRNKTVAVDIETGRCGSIKNCRPECFPPSQELCSVQDPAPAIVYTCRLQIKQRGPIASLRATSVCQGDQEVPIIQKWGHGGTAVCTNDIWTLVNPGHNYTDGPADVNNQSVTLGIARTVIQPYSNLVQTAVEGDSVLVVNISQYTGLFGTAFERNLFKATVSRGYYTAAAAACVVAAVVFLLLAVHRWKRNSL